MLYPPPPRIPATGKQSAASKYAGDNFFRYLNLLKNARFGLNVPRGSLLNYLKIKAGRLSNVVGATKTYPPIVQMYSLQRCNLKCNFCDLGYYGPPENWQDYELTTETFNKILRLDIVKKALVICFTGGESLLNKDMPELMKMARAKKHIVGMISNGLLLENRLNELKNVGLCDIQLSVYENTKDKLINILPKVSPYFPLNASYVLPKSQLVKSANNNFQELFDVIKMCKETGCASLKFNICQPNGSTKAAPESIFENDSLYNEFAVSCKRLFKSVNFSGYGVKKQALPSKKFTVFFPFPVSVDISQRSCTQPWTLFPIFGNGDVILCCGGIPVGNIFKEGESILNAEKVCKIRETFLNKNIPLEKECINCVFRNGAYSSNF